MVEVTLNDGFTMNVHIHHTTRTYKGGDTFKIPAHEAVRYQRKGYFV